MKNKPMIILGVLVFTMVVLFGVRTAVSNRISTSGVALGKTQDKLKEYKTQNAILREKVSNLSSLSYISETAEKRGFVESKKSFALTKTRPIALKE